MSWWNDSNFVGDRVRWEALERADLIDVRALQTLLYNSLAEAVGGLMGSGSGCLSAPVPTYQNSGTTYEMVLGPFQFYYSFPMRRSDGTLIQDPGTTTAPNGSSRT